MIYKYFNLYSSFHPHLLHPNQSPLLYIMYSWWLSGRESACNAGDLGSIPGSGRFPWKGAQQSTPVSLPGKFHGQKSLAGYSPHSCKELAMIEATEHTCYTVSTSMPVLKLYARAGVSFPCLSEGLSVNHIST